MWNQKELAAKASVSPATIAHLETGRIFEPTPETANAIAKALGFDSVTDLLRRTPITDDDRRQAADTANDWPPEMVDELVRRTASLVFEQMTPNSDAAAAFRQGLDHQESVLTTPDAYRIQPSEAMRLIPQAPGVTAGVGAGGGLDDIEIYMHPDEIEGRDLAWARVKGECMVPWLEEGDILIFERISERDIQDRDYLVLVLLDEGAEGAHVVKRVRWGG
ncbi:MAG TPA: helix-turn-helix domain-containing protein, partial [Chloroflexota bacterium]|nr:helix-turn-helix domain-containing protein [Chloroflexota bacterium]